MHNTAQTSRDSYSQHVSSGNKQKQRQAIMDCIKSNIDTPYYQENMGFTRRQISVLSGLELGATSGRVNKLIDDDLLVKRGTIKCFTTGVTVGLVGLPEKQGEMYD